MQIKTWIGLEDRPRENEPAPHIDFMSDYLEYLRYFAVNFNNTTGAGGIGGVWNQGVTSSATQVVGGAYMLRLLKDENYTTQRVQQFELDLSSSPDPNRPKKADIVELKGTTTILVECKSWVHGDGNFSGLRNGSSASYVQFVTYLKNINSLSELKYYFDARRTNITETYIKEVFQALFKNNAQSIFNELGQTKFSQLFGVNSVSRFLSEKVPQITGEGSIYSFIKVK